MMVKKVNTSHQVKAETRSPVIVPHTSMSKPALLTTDLLVYYNGGLEVY